MVFGSMCYIQHGKSLRVSELFYTNVNRFGNDILVRGYNKGKRVKGKVKFKPTLFIPTKEQTTFKTINGKPVGAIRPGLMSECRDFVNKYKDVDNFEIHGNQNYVHQYISTTFHGDIKFDRSRVNVTTIDIEVQSDEGFPQPDHALYPVTAITCKNNIDDIFYTWGVGDYDSSKTIVPDVHIRYIKCEDERDLLIKFIEEWSRNYPDVVTGWNSRMFDMTYLVNRIVRVVGDKFMKKLSPWNIVNQQELIIAGKSHQVYDVYGIQQLDYLDLFKKFAYTYGTQESYRLDNIGNVVLGERKLDYSEFGDLNNLYKQDYQKFIDYNIKDVQLVDRLEDKLGLITLCMTIAYKGHVNYVEAFRTVGVWDSILYNDFLDKNIVVPPKKQGHKERQIEGAHVKDPIQGMHEWVVSFDLNSLYPHIMMQYNLSPETVMDETVPNVSVDKLLEKEKYTFNNNHIMTARGNLFDRTHKGLIPTIVEKFYNERSAVKKKMLRAQQKLVKVDKKDKHGVYQLEKEIATYGNQQMAIKILMNSLYGATSNEYFRYFDQRIAESITMSGQLTIRWAENKINEFMNKTMKTDNQDYVVAIDTDSLYIRMGDLVKKINPSDPVKFLDKVATQKIEPLLAESYEELKEYMNCAEQKMVMAREVIAERGIWTGKKHYVLNVWNNEGVQYEEPQLKVQGIEAVRSSTPAVCRDLIKSTIKKILTSDETTVQKIIAQEKKNFRELPVEDVAFPRSANNLDKYVDGSLIYRKGTPIHIRASLLHNYHIDKMKLGNKYEKIYSGEKIKFVYLRKPNRLYENVVAFKNILPQEFNIRDHIDYDLQFEKAFVEPIKTILDAIGWQVEKRATLEDFWT